MERTYCLLESAPRMHTPEDISVPALPPTMVRPLGRCERLLLLVAVELLLLHLAVLLACPGAKLASNAIQSVAPLLAMLVCSLRIRREPDPAFRLLWKQLRIAFALWMAGQTYWFFAMVAGWHFQYPSLADFVWLSFAFPLLILIVTTSTGRSLDRVAWLDLTQAGLGLLVLYVLVFAPEHFLDANHAYNLQGLTLLLACGLRLSLTRRDGERRFFCDLGLYLAIYSVCSYVGNFAGAKGFGAGSLADLSWSLPFVAFSFLVLRPGKPTPVENLEQSPTSAVLRRLQVFRQSRGLSAVGLTALSLGAAGMLCLFLPLIGVGALAAVFLIFAARTTIREQQLESAQASLENQALFDSLTGLPNRVQLKRKLEAALATAPPGRIAVLAIDLDRFKAINDSLGHVFGDRLLIKIADLLQQAIRPHDLLARLGGDEFAVLLHDVASDAAAENIATRIVQLLQAPIPLDDRTNYLTASVGIVRAADRATAEDLLRHADCAMYAAKNAGKNGAKMFSPAMQDRASNNLETEVELRWALQNGGVEAWYQPIYALDGTQIHGFEALARWRHATRGMVSPADFVPIAEDTGLILELGSQVLRQACAHLQQWNDRFQTRLTMSVNISARQFSDPHLLDTIQAALAETGLDPRLLKLEVTESVLLSDPQAASDVLTAARKLGIQICLDDFGTGYSSLSYLLEFPFDVVKIDRSFVRSIEQDSRRLELVRTIMHLVRQLEKQVISEGIETEGEMACLRELNCGLVQGFFLSKPLPADRVAPLLCAGRDFLQTAAQIVAGTPAAAHTAAALCSY